MTGFARRTCEVVTRKGKSEMTCEPKSHQMFAAVAVTVFLLLTAWGNAIAMMVISSVALVIGLFLFRRNPVAPAFGAVVACVVAVVVALLLHGM